MMLDLIFRNKDRQIHNAVIQFFKDNCENSDSNIISAVVDYYRQEKVVPCMLIIEF